jgi:hypothetical protein
MFTASSRVCFLLQQGKCTSSIKIDRMLNQNYRFNFILQPIYESSCVIMLVCSSITHYEPVYQFDELIDIIMY